MEEYLVYRNDAPCGTVRMETRGLYTFFSVCCGARKERLYSLFLDGETGSVLLGVPEWQDGCYVLRRTLANRALEPIGKVRCARLMPREDVEEETDAEQGWLYLEHPEYFFHRLMPQLSGGQCYWKQGEKGRYLAVPIDDGKPFLLARYFCFARVMRLWGRAYAVFLFDDRDQPCFFDQQ